jgi:uncharacterized membrane protein
MRRISQEQLGLVLAFVALVAGSAPVQAKASYIQIDIGNSIRTEADLINASGAVAGHYDNGASGVPAFLRAPDGTITTFSPPQAFITTPTDLNDKGAVAGFYQLTDDEMHAFYRDPAGVLTPFDPPAAGSFTVRGLNNRSEITGSYKGGQASFIRHANGRFTTFHLRGAKFGTYAVDIDDNGNVVGGFTDADVVPHGFLRTRDGAVTRFDPPCGGTFNAKTIVVAIDNEGWIAGQCDFSSNEIEGYLRAPDGSFAVFGAPTGGKFPVVLGLNNLGAVTGCYFDQPMDLEHGYIRNPNGKFVVFDVPDHASTQMCAQAINDAGQVTGFAFTPNGQTEVGFIRTP